MLSYQHSFHAGNLADVHKHALLATALARMAMKDKQLSYIETHAGRGLYDLSGADARKTAEAAQGIEKTSIWFDSDHPYTLARTHVQDAHGPSSYPGSPLIAEALLRPDDTMHLAELHPGEYALLRQFSRHPDRRVHKQDGLDLALSLAPPTPRRGLMLIDPPYEVKSDYDRLPRTIAQIARAWNVGVVMLWYPILTDNRHIAMTKALRAGHPDALVSEVRFPPARPGHGMVGSGLFTLNAPFGLDVEARRLHALYATL